MSQYFIGLKIVEAWPEEKDGRPGYGVKYEGGYVSWSPKEAFEDAYMRLGDNVPHDGPTAKRLIEAAGDLVKYFREEEPELRRSLFQRVYDLGFSHGREAENRKIMQEIQHRGHF